MRVFWGWGSVIRSVLLESEQSNSNFRITNS